MHVKRKIGSLARSVRSVRSYGEPVNSRGVRLALIVVGAIALIVGTLWVGQGSNLIPGSVMTGSGMWLGIGLIVAVVGLVLLVLGVRGTPGRRRSS
ncbi:MAG: hypothetical protein JWQ92_2947 [Amnibacterium sp.]|nr:hypothetical protein [Amnibacterium sp.]